MMYSDMICLETWYLGRKEGWQCIEKSECIGYMMIVISVYFLLP
jgi:hypothetical protein